MSDDDQSWRDDQSLIMAAGVVAAVLVAILIYAVIRTADGARVPVSVPPPATTSIPLTYTTSPTTTPSYTTPSVETTEVRAPEPPPATTTTETMGG